MVFWRVYALYLVSGQRSACLSSTAVSDKRNTADVLTSVLHYGGLCMSCIVLGTLKDNYDVSAGFFVVQFNGFMSLTS